MPKGIYKRPLTDKQKLILYLTMPGPIGLGLTIRQAAKHLGHEESGSHDCAMLKRIKRWYPEAYEEYMAAKRAMKRQCESLKNIWHYSNLRDGKWSQKIIQKF